MATSDMVFDVPGSVSATALGVFSATVERHFANLAIIHTTDSEDAFARTRRATSARLLVDAHHVAAALTADGIHPARIILITPDEEAVTALDAMDAGIERVFLGSLTQGELEGALREEKTNELSASQAPRLTDLGIKMATIAQEIETLLHAPAQPGTLRHVESTALLGSEPSASQVRALIRSRHARANHFPGELFADPAWDILLDLMAARLEAKAVSVSSLCIAAAVPPTTALRWIKTMTDGGLLERKADPTDGRRIFIDLSDRAMEAMLAYFARTAGTPSGLLAA